MKRWLILLIILVPLVIAENFDEYQYLVMNLEIDSGINLISKENPKLESLNADLKLVPKNDVNQNVDD